MQVVLVEDDAAIALPLARALRREGYRVRVATTAAEALAEVDAAPPGVLLLDLGLPDRDGIEVCARVREHHPSLPILMLTARAEEVDAVVGLDAGADDYVTKPFRLGELLARVRALRRRGGNLAAGAVRVDRAARRAWRDDRELELSPKEFDLLALLVAEAGTVVRRERIMAEVWDENWWGSTKTLDMHMVWLRRKLGEPGLITTVRGIGFRFESA
jgi:DNA-binding response OmpR family regulator